VTERATLRVPGTPPSFNAIGYRSHWAVGQRHKKLWQEWISIALMEQAVPRGLTPPGLSKVSATATLRFGQRRRRDEGNFRVIIEKALGDALVQGGWLADDTAEQYRFGALNLYAPVEKPETIIVLDYER
jgi:hypothetical protein